LSTAHRRPLDLRNLRVGLFLRGTSCDIWWRFRVIDSLLGCESPLISTGAVEERIRRTSSVPKVHHEATQYDHVRDEVQPIRLVSLDIDSAEYTPWLQILT